MKLKIEDIFLSNNIKGISFNSKSIEPGSVFFAMQGENFDGNDYINEALANGAAIIFTDNKSKADAERIFFLEDIRSGLALAAGIKYPEIPENLIAVTGTNGKSSVVSYVHQILSILGQTSACMGTLGIESNVEVPYDITNHGANLTTSDSVSFRKALFTLNNVGVKNVAFEASSHGLHQKRLGDVKAKTAAFTSFSQDHLEYHQTMESYLNSKLVLFTDNLCSGGEVVVNSEVMFFDFIKKFLEERKIAYSIVGKSGDINVVSNAASIESQEISFNFLGKNYKFRSDIIGSFQATNLLIAAKLVYNLGVNFDAIVATLPKLVAVSGRLQRVTKPEDDYQVFVDYAHTPDALEKSLKELVKLKEESCKLYVVFGCGGNRDASKRPIMGEIASLLADVVVITDDNPRSEDAAKIRKDILAGAKGAEVIGDRKKAIIDTIHKLNKGDILLIAGKGHENYQIIGKETIKFSDVEIASDALKNRKMV
ncbi:MAG: UDP-N-acetylmuramoyl-L-alanyl-D-glutamate--2,6-diaminopimelate ligase [Rickettsiaceae bacterium]